MTLENKIIYAFVAGEVSEAFWGRSDLSKYELGAAYLENFYVDYRGGLVSRQGTEFGAFLFAPEGKLHRFQGTVSDYLLVFTDYKLRFAQNNSYITEAPQTISAITRSVTATFTCTAHGYSDDDVVVISASSGMVELHGRCFAVTSSTTDTFQLAGPSGEILDTSLYAAADGTETVARAYTVETPYPLADLPTLNVVQRYNTVRLTHINHARRILTFNDVTDWDLSEAVAGSSIDPPDAPTGTASASGSAGTSFALTSIDANGVESVVSAYLLETAMVNYTVTSGSYTINWTPVPGAASYNIYRSLVLPNGSDVVRGADLSYIGTSSGTQFTDSNITPDYSKTPPVNYDPFAVNTIYQIDIDNVGAGYTKNATMSVTTGTGFRGYPIVNNAAQISGVVIVDGGSGYTAPVVSVTGSPTTSAEFTVRTKGTPGKTNPSLFTVFQQRGIYFATEEEPATLWASKPSLLDNYDYSTIVNEGDGYTFTLDSTAVRPIKHALALKNGLLIFTDEGIVQLRAETGKAVTALSALAESQVKLSISDAPPIAIELDVVFLAENGNSLNTLLYTEYTESFKMQDLSILSSHLLKENNQITRLVYNANPYKLIYMPREDGTMLTLTHLREQEVFGWSRHATYGNYKDCVEIEESGQTYVYLLVERFLQGAWKLMYERVPVRDDSHAENYWGVDCGRRLSLTYPDAGIYGNTVAGTATLLADEDVFTADDVGKIIYYAGGKLEVTAYTSAREVEALYIRDATATVRFGPEELPQRAGSGEWSMDMPVSSVGGLWHLEGETVSVCYDGDAELGRVVENGTITLQHPSTKVIVGLPYTCRGASLPLVIPNTVVEGQDNKVFSAIPRVSKTRGLAFGDSFDRLEEMQDYSDEDWGEQINLHSDVSHVIVDSSYGKDAQVFWGQEYPLPATLLGFVAKMDIGQK